MSPTARECVLVRGRPGLYFVLTVYQEFGYADLVELHSATLVEGVQFDIDSICPSRSLRVTDSIR